MSTRVKTLLPTLKCLTQFLALCNKLLQSTYSLLRCERVTSLQADFIFKGFTLLFLYHVYIVAYLSTTIMVLTQQFPTQSCGSTSKLQWVYGPFFYDTQPHHTYVQQITATPYNTQRRLTNGKVPVGGWTTQDILSPRYFGIIGRKNNLQLLLFTLPK